MSAWEIITRFKELSAPSNDEVRTFEVACLAILNANNSNSVHVSEGYSETLPRYKTTPIECKKTLKQLKKHLWTRQKQLIELERIVKRVESAVQKSCEHEWVKDWESRHRSHYDCAKCGAYR